MRPTALVLVAFLIAGCATAYEPAALSWGYRVNVAGLGYLMKLFCEEGVRG
jgi:hypothetical protein